MMYKSYVATVENALGAARRCKGFAVLRRMKTRGAVLGRDARDQAMEARLIGSHPQCRRNVLSLPKRAFS